MKKLLLISILLVFISCKESNDCDKRLGGNVGLMIHGVFMPQTEDERIKKVSIVKIVDPKDWEFNEYFTGENFSPNEEDEMQVPITDSCQLKDLYFQYLKEVK